MSSARVFVARLAGCSVFDPAGDRVGKVRDVLLVYRRLDAPRVVGLVVEIPGRRRVFVSIGRVTSIGSGQIITTGLINVRRFEQRGGEVRVIAELLGRRVSFVDGSGDATVEDVAIEEVGPGEWQLAQLFVRRPKTSPSPFAKGATAFAGWREVRESVSTEAQSAEQYVASLSELKPADLASTLLDLPQQRMLEVAGELSDDRLADVLEEMPESEQVEILGQLDDDRAADVLDQMQPDDAADLIAQLSDERGEALLELMEPEEADDVRMLLSYAPESAGGLMTTEPIIVSAEATVAEGLALIRRHELAPALGAAVCVTLPPYEPPTGRFLGMVHFQRMLRYPPHERLGTLLDQGMDPITPDTSAAEVARILASYNLVSVPVVDESHRLVGVVTIDDVLDYLLPDDWRSHGDDEPRAPVTSATRSVPVVAPASRAKTGRRGRRGSRG
ncbi:MULTISPECIES: magnesium transporter MgtE N-terminal domain-containing protein [unclassified Rathayibacter]|uniref:magnesium transporter MgtE N-terminal domain-containing protein n=1 Tax=unclassified Rathayibacter TaxID=2609250 RepID=UPI00188B1D59|nr:MULTISPECIES: CBS domain-containing protein [unclassified Rathayibacter]MBF4463497.1 CBS domain-containing protein [Rathayibacter sp. VKM Ac-2879]MBF4504781.1 CBS domain-containing protein [Rathayibacter sp. VKM Ac-2878]